MGDFADDMRALQEADDTEAFLAARTRKPLTPYDTGQRLEPKRWVTEHNKVNAPADAYGKVDFENDESATIATVWFERFPDGLGYMMHVNTPDSIVIMLNGEPL